MSKVTSVTGEIKINAPKEKVWAILADLAAVQNFHPAVKKSYYITDRKEGVHAARRCELAPFGSIDETVIEWKEGEEIVLNVHNGRKQPPFKRFIARETLHNDGAGTIVTLTFEYEMKFGFLGELMNKMMMESKFKKIHTDMLHELKVHSEKLSSTAHVQSENQT